MKLAAYITGSILVIGLAIWGSVRILTPKIAYVRNGDLVEGFEGMKEAKMLYKQKMEKWQANIDTLQSDYTRTQSKLTLNGGNAEARKNLEKQEMNIRNYVTALEEKAKEEDDKMTEAVINQINTRVKEYGVNHGYDIIFGLTTQGNVMYGSEGKDITKDVLEDLNNWYKTK
jgi:outer membrane protein